MPAVCVRLYVHVCVSSFRLKQADDKKDQGVHMGMNQQVWKYAG